MLVNGPMAIACNVDALSIFTVVSTWMNFTLNAITVESQTKPDNIDRWIIILKTVQNLLQRVGLIHYPFPFYANSGNIHTEFCYKQVLLPCLYSNVLDLSTVGASNTQIDIWTFAYINTFLSKHKYDYRITRSLRWILLSGISCYSGVSAISMGYCPLKASLVSSPA